MTLNRFVMWSSKLINSCRFGVENNKKLTTLAFGHFDGCLPYRLSLLGNCLVPSVLVMTNPSRSQELAQPPLAKGSFSRPTERTCVEVPPNICKQPLVSNLSWIPLCSVQKASHPNPTFDCRSHSVALVHVVVFSVTFTVNLINTVTCSWMLAINECWDCPLLF